MISVVMLFSPTLDHSRSSHPNEAPHPSPQDQSGHPDASDHASSPTSDALLGPKTFDFTVPRSNTSWRSLDHFSASDLSSHEPSAASIIEHYDQPNPGLFEPAPQPLYYRRPPLLGEIEVIEEVSEEPSFDPQHSDSVRDYASGSLPSSIRPPSIPFAHQTPVIPHSKGRMEPSHPTSPDSAIHQSPPSPRSDGPLHQDSQISSDPQPKEQRIFHFTYDTFARKHLSRLVEEIDGFSSSSLPHASSLRIHALIGSPGEVPSSNVSRSSNGLAHSTPPSSGLYAGHTPFRPMILPTYSQRAREEAAWRASFLEPSAYASESLCGPGHHPHEDQEDESFDPQPRFAATAPARSSKRIRLIASLPPSSLPPMSPLRTARLRDSVLIASERKTKRLAADNAATARSSDTSEPKQTVPRDRLAEARALMERIRAKATQVTSPVEALDDSGRSTVDGSNLEAVPNVRPRNPTPLTASSVPYQWKPPTGPKLGVTQRKHSQENLKHENVIETEQDFDHDTGAGSLAETDNPDVGQVDAEEDDFAWTISNEGSENDSPKRNHGNARHVEADESADADIGEDDSSCQNRSQRSLSVDSSVQHHKALDTIQQRLASTAAASIRQALLDAPSPGTRPPGHPRRPSPFGSGRSVASFMPGSAARRHFATQPVSSTDHAVGKDAMRIRKPLQCLSAASLQGTVSDRQASGTGSTYTLTSTTLQSKVAPGSSKLGLMTIGPADVEDLLQQQRLGGMVFDAARQTWRRRPSDKHADTDSQVYSDDDEVDEEEDVFKDIESLNSRGVGDDATNPERHHISVTSENHESLKHQREPTTTDGGDTDMPRNVPTFVKRASSDHEGSAIVDSDSEAITIAPPKSALKARLAPLHALSPPTPGPAHIEHSTRPNRSVSFQDGRKNGKIIGLDESRKDADDGMAKTLEKDSATWASSRDELSSRTRRIGAALDELIGVGKADASLISLGSTTKKVRAKANGQRKVSGSSAPGGGAHDRTFLTDCSFGMTRERLLKLITDIEPYEPLWEKLKVLNLGGKRVESLVRLDEFLPNLDEVDLLSFHLVQDDIVFFPPGTPDSRWLSFTFVRHSNELGFLTGLPRTVRMLLVNQNRLTDLASFAHLSNLERLDVSQNGLTSLERMCLPARNFDE